MATTDEKIISLGVLSYNNDKMKEYVQEEIDKIPSSAVDDTLSDTSENPVQNKVVKAAIDAVASSVGCGELYSGDNTSEIFNNTNNPDESLKNKIIGITSGEHYIHIEGLNNTVDGTDASVGSDGVSNIAGTHIEGYHNKAFGQGSHAEGIYSKALNIASHAEGSQGEASGQSSHVGGSASYAIGDRSFAHGKVVYANNEDEVAFGKYNQSNSDTLFSIGNGTIDEKSNAFEITETSGKLHNKIIATIDDLVAHSGNDEIHVTAEEKAAWNGLSNPNLLTNPDFKINQRGLTTYTGSGYTVDRWRSSSSLTVNVSDNITISAVAATGYFEEYLDRGNDFDNKLLTLSAHLSDGTVLSASGVCPQAPESGRPLFITITLPDGNDVRMYRGSTAEKFSLLCQVRVYSGKSIGNLRALKLETGSVATPFIPPDPATELVKCQRYYQIRSTGDIAVVDLRPSMRTISDIKLRSDGNYEYIAEL